MSFFALAEAELLGFVISKEGIKPDPGKVRQLKEWPDPVSGDNLVSFRAFANYLKSFIPGYVQLTDKFKVYARKGGKIAAFWKDEVAVQGFRDLKEAIADNVPLVNPDYTAASTYHLSGRPFECFIDASDVGWAVTLTQRREVHGTPRPIVKLKVGPLVKLKGIGQHLSENCTHYGPAY